ncbi:MAG: hypothetical protein IKM91_07720 [Candidatus Methanomethylophilaceae archaeon]|nr:hypothetical protein [Candidatus Methanomethylophilaceae archaeon]MBR6871488.1 hypothetical protein [Candidatus Methanomethylophilaceae archaeon]
MARLARPFFILVDTFWRCPLFQGTSTWTTAPSLTRGLAERFLEDLGRSRGCSFQEFEERLLKAGIRMSVSRLHWMLV